MLGDMIERLPSIKEEKPAGDWRDKALCKVDPELFFTEGTTPEAREKIAQAKEMCGRCLAQFACLDYALPAVQDGSLKYGIWGGLTMDELKKLAYRNRRREIRGF